MKAESPTTVEAAAKGLSKIFFSLVVVFLPNQKGLSVRHIKKEIRKREGFERRSGRLNIAMFCAGVSWDVHGVCGGRNTDLSFSVSA